MTDNPQLVVFGGPNGSGKSTLYYSKFANAQLKGVEYVNPDEYTKATGSEIDGGKSTIRRRHHLIKTAQSFITETTLSGKSVLRLIEKANGAGYVTTLIYLCTSSPQLNIERVAQRVARGGHHVNDADVIRRYHSSLENLPKVVSKVDQAHVFSTDIGLQRVLTVANGVLKPRDGVELPCWLPDQLYC